MISTNTTQPAPAVPGRSRIVTTNNLKPREPSLLHREYPGVIKRETRKVTGKLTIENLEERQRIAKREACRVALKAATLEKATAQAPVAPKKKAGRPKKES